MQVLLGIIAIAALLSSRTVRRAVPAESALAFGLVAVFMLFMLFSGRMV